MFHHLLHLPFLILHFVLAALLIMTLAVVLRPLACIARHRCGSRRDHASAPRDVDNNAFNDYRRATLRRLEQEAEEFGAYLNRLRHAADAAAFESFLKARRTQGESAS
jgi:hypothetical protein